MYQGTKYYLQQLGTEGQNASFDNLRTWGAFLVSSEKKAGNIPYVKITSEKGRECIIENPWPGKRVRITSGKNKPTILSGDQLTFKTLLGETYVLKLVTAN